MALLIGVISCWVCLSLLTGSSAGYFTDITSTIFGDYALGTLAAFGDYNGDKIVDIFIISESGKTVDVLLWHSQTPHLNRTETSIQLDKSSDEIITSVAPGDFDGDSYMDIMITTSNTSSSDSVNVYIYWYSTTSSILVDKTQLPDVLLDQPLLLDYDGNMIVDLFGVTTSNTRYYWAFDISRNVTKVEQVTTSTATVRIPSSNSFIDLNSDYYADLFVTADLDGDAVFEFMPNVDGTLTWDENYITLPDGLSPAIIGQSSLVDINGDGETDHVLPICLDAECEQSQIIYYNFADSEWYTMLSSMYSGDVIMGFYQTESYPITLRAGDYDLDRHTDFLVVMESKSGDDYERQVVLLENSACQSSLCDGERSFSIRYSFGIDNAVMGAFYDVNEDGILDVLIVSDEDGDSPQMNIFENTFDGDTLFLKVLVLSGLCYKDCPDGNDPYGVNQPGCAVYYTTTDSNGNDQFGRAGQLSQSSHFSLQLPYSVFGLGRQPNYLEYMYVGVPRSNSEIKYAEFSQIIPNSQIIVIPYPLDDPSSWIMKLLLTPNEIILQTGAALLGLCGFLSGIIGLLHWKEKREDDKEKRQDAHKFHFDAM